MNNKEVAQHFKLLGKLLELHGENQFKTRTYSNAAFQITRLEKQLKNMQSEDIAAVKGFGKAVVAKIETLLQTSTLPQLEAVVEQTPQGLLELVSLKGIGAKKLGVLWKELGIESAGELLYACKENHLTLLKGFGEKTQDNIKNALEYYLKNQHKYHYANALVIAENLLSDIKEAGFESCSLTGAIRRKVDVIEKIELIALDKDKSAILTFLQKAVDTVKESEHEIEGLTIEGMPYHIVFSDEDHFTWKLFESTATEEHLKLTKASNSKGIFKSEEAIYESLNLPYFEPELREGLQELQLIDKMPNLIKPEDIKGVVHNHSTYSDGGNTLEEMARASKELGYEYFVISDHSKAAFYAGGLTEEEIEQQHIEVDALNKTMAPFKIFKSIECDILNDGTLDYDDTILASFDLVIASIHSNLKMDETKAMQRIIKAIENPYTNILGHMTGRLLLAREGYPLDHKKVIDACVANKVVIELNASPHRLDIDWRLIPYALNKGAIISINPDAHSIAGIQDIFYGVCAARKGYLEADQTLNAQSADDFLKWLKK